MTLSDALGSNHRLKTTANLSAADGVDDGDAKADVVADGDDDPILLSRITFAAMLRLNCALAPTLSTEEEGEEEEAFPS